MKMELIHVYSDVKWFSHLGKQFGRVFNSLNFVIQARVSALGIFVKLLGHV